MCLGTWNRFASWCTCKGTSSSLANRIHVDPIRLFCNVWEELWIVTNSTVWVSGSRLPFGRFTCRLIFPNTFFQSEFSFIASFRPFLIFNNNYTSHVVNFGISDSVVSNLISLNYRISHSHPSVPLLFFRLSFRDSFGPTSGPVPVRSSGLKGKEEY